jgi:hypothetical protein
MKDFIKLSLLTILMIAIISLFFEYCINRPLNVYLQYALSAVMLIVTVAFLVYLVKQIIKILNS